MTGLRAASLQFQRGQRRILESVDLAFERGRVTAVLGPNGAGKSTLLACLAGLAKPGSGSVELDGRSIGGLSGPARARRLAFLPQSPEIAWPVSVHTLVALARIPFRGISSQVEDEAAVRDAMDRAHVAQWAQREVTTLSGGERARVLLARLVAGQADWILADEPFAGLDPAHQFDAADLLRSLSAEGRGVLFTVHDLSLAARVADRVIMLDKGRVVADGTPAEALSSSTLRQVYGIEAEWISLNDAGAAPVIAIRGRSPERDEHRPGNP